MDALLQDSLQILPEENKKLISSFGGIGGFLMASSLFRTYNNGKNIGLKQDRAIIAETLETSHSTDHTIQHRITSHDDNNHTAPTISETYRKKERMNLAPSWPSHDELINSASYMSNGLDHLNDILGPSNGSKSMLSLNEKQYEPIGPTPFELMKGHPPLDAIGTKKKPQLEIPGPSKNPLPEIPGPSKNPLPEIPGPSRNPSIEIPEPSKNPPLEIPRPPPLESHRPSKNRPLEIPESSKNPPLESRRPSKNPPLEIPGPSTNPPLESHKPRKNSPTEPNQHAPLGIPGRDRSIIDRPIQNHSEKNTTGSKIKTSSVPVKTPIKDKTSYRVNGDIDEIVDVKKEKMVANKQNGKEMCSQNTTATVNSITSNGSYEGVTDWRNTNGTASMNYEQANEPEKNIATSINSPVTNTGTTGITGVTTDSVAINTGIDPTINDYKQFDNDADWPPFTGVVDIEKIMVNRGINTDPLPHVDNYRERYDKAIKEKKSVEKKLEVSEDRMVRMQKQQGHELEIVEKKTKRDCHKVRDIY